MIYNLLMWSFILLVPAYLIVMFARDYARQERTRENIERTLGLPAKKQ